MQVKFPIPHTLSSEIIISDAKTGIIEKIIPAKSFVKNLINSLYCSMAQTGLAGCLDTGGVSRTISATNLNDLILHTGVASDSSLGIVVGTGSTAVTVSDTKLQTQITHGVGAGQLQYGGQSWLSPVTVGSDRYYEISRTFTNGSGADITVNEIGIYFSANGFKFCMERTINSFVVTNGGAKTVTYRIKVTV